MSKLLIFSLFIILSFAIQKRSDHLTNGEDHNIFGLFKDQPNNPKNRTEQ